MVNVTFYLNQKNKLTGFDCAGHADFAESQDIVCAGISALVINCINSIELLTEDVFFCDRKKNGGNIQFRLAEGFSEKSQLLLRSLALGLQNMERDYEGNIDLIFEEV
ncbi:MAG: ribosomal-processing cysteine protease Prp [Lachnospiraceae bacterium]|nr:ribosomal-processing cysteine protease Prp [Lachnospiraceae bacterium]